jgi:hypothetical protein
MEKFKERMEKYNNGTTMPNLTMQVKSKMWLTPSATNITERSEEGLKKREKMRNKSGRKTVPPGSLAEQVKYGYPITDMREAKMWPTPTAHLSKEGAYPAEFTRKTPTLTAEVHMRMWPTPQASDNRDRGNLGSGAVQRRMAKGKQVMLSQSVSTTSGALNPEWVEWLMGYPIGWTDLNH